MPGSISNGGVLAGQTASGGGTITWTWPARSTRARRSTSPMTRSSPRRRRPAGLTNTADITALRVLADRRRARYDGPQASSTVDRRAAPREHRQERAGRPARLHRRVEGLAPGHHQRRAPAVPSASTPSTRCRPTGATTRARPAISVDGGPAAGVEPALGTTGGRQTLTWTDLGDLPVGQTIVVDFTATPGAGRRHRPRGRRQRRPDQHRRRRTPRTPTATTAPPAAAPTPDRPTRAVAHIDSADVAVDQDPRSAPPWPARTSPGASPSPTPAPTRRSGPFTVTDPVPDPASPARPRRGTGWSCSTAGGTVTCTRTSAADTLVSGARPSRRSRWLPTSRAGTAAGTHLANTASVTSRTHDPAPGNNTETDGRRRHDRVRPVDPQAAERLAGGRPGRDVHPRRGERRPVGPPRHRDGDRRRAGGHDVRRIKRHRLGLRRWPRAASPAPARTTVRSARCRRSP